MAATTYFDIVQKLYIAFYGRPADPLGRTFWAGRIDAASGNVASVVTAFAISSEATTLFPPGLSTSALVDSIYLQAFGRHAEDAGLQFWADGIDNGTFTRGEAMWIIVSNARGADLAAVNAKLDAANAFVTALDTPAEVAAYAGNYAAGVGRVYLRPVVDGTTAALQIAAADTALGKLVTPPTTFALSVDNPSVSEGNTGTKALTFTLSLDNAPASAVSVAYETLATGTATAGVDFASAAGTVTFAPGQTAARVTVTLTSDTTSENNETVEVRFSGPSAGAPITATGTIANDDAPTPSGSSLVTVDENQTSVGVFAATAATAVTYSLQGADAVRFVIGAGTGVISFVTAPDFEAPASATASNVYHVNVVATDATGQASVQAATVTVNNVNEAPTLEPVGSLSMAENAAGVAPLVSADPDAGDAITYLLSGADAGKFQVVDGELRFIAAPDFETPTDADGDNVYQVTVTARDAGGLTSAASTLDVTLTDIPEPQTFILTAGANTFTGGSGDDLFQGTGGAGFLNTTDTLDGGTGTDRLTALLAAGTSPRPTISNVEAIELTAGGATATLDATDIEAGGDGLNLLTNAGSLAGRTVTVSNLDALVNLDLANVAGATNLQFTANALFPLAQTMTIGISGGTPSVTITRGGGGGGNELETIDIDVRDVASTLTLDVDVVDTTTINVAGTQAFTLAGGAGLDTVTWIDASALEGAFTYNATDGGAVGKLVIGAAGNFNNSITCDDGADTINGGAGDDSLVGNGGADTINGGDGADTITGGAGIDVVDGQEGGDTYVFADGQFLLTDTINDTGGSGEDVIRYTVGGTVLTDLLFANKSGVERLTLLGADAGGNDATLDVFAMSLGIRTVDLNSTQDVAVTFGFTAGLTVNDDDANSNNTIATGAGNDTINLVNGADTVTAGDGDDTVVWAAGNTLADSVDGGAGNDTFAIGASMTDAATLVGGAGMDTLSLSSTNGATLTLTAASRFSGIETIVLASQTDIGGANSGFLYSLTLDDGNAVDTSDVLTVNASALRSDVDADTPGTQSETLGFSAAGVAAFRVSVAGGGGNDSITGGSLDDTLIGGLGDDVLTGGTGNDTYVFAASGAANGNDTIELVAASDVLNLAAFLAGGAVDQHGGASAAIVAYSAASTGDANIANKVALFDTNGAGLTAAALAAAIEGTGNAFALNGKAVVITGDASSPASAAMIYFVDSSLDGNDTNVTVDDVVLVGTTSAAFDIESLTTANFAFA